MNTWLSLDHKNIWHPYSPLSSEQTNLLIERGEGLYVITSDGRRIIDAISSWWVNIHGHAHPHIAQALYQQASTLEHVIFAGFTHKPAIQLSENLLKILPDNQKKVFFSDNGSTAVEVALKMAMQFWHNQGIEKRGIIALDGAYHGDTFGAMAVGERGLFTIPFQSYLFDVTFLPFPDGTNDTLIVERFKERVKTDNVGIFIYEPLVQGASGMRIYSPALLDKLLAVARENNVICIADEVFTGFGRTGKWFASEYMEQQPDIMCLSKGITGGTLPLGVTTCSDTIAVAFLDRPADQTFFHGHSYTANPLVCAAANASFELLMDPACKLSIDTISRMHTSFAAEVQNNPHVRTAKCIGTILSIEIDQGTTSYTNDLRKHIFSYFMERNILLRPLGNILYVLPPYCIREEELQRVYDSIRDFLKELKK